MVSCLQYGAVSDQGNAVEAEDGGASAALLSITTCDEENKPTSLETTGVFGRLFKAMAVDAELGYTLLGVIFGIVLGLILSASLESLPAERKLAVRIVGFPGSIFLHREAIQRNNFL